MYFSFCAIQYTSMVSHSSIHTWNCVLMHATQNVRDILCLYLCLCMHAGRNEGLVPFKINQKPLVYSSPMNHNFRHHVDVFSLSYKRIKNVKSYILHAHLHFCLMSHMLQTSFMFLSAHCKHFPPLSDGAINILLSLFCTFDTCPYLSVTFI